MLLFLLYYINTATVKSLSNGFSNLTCHFCPSGNVAGGTFRRKWHGLCVYECLLTILIREKTLVLSFKTWHVITRYIYTLRTIAAILISFLFLSLLPFFLWCGNNKIIFRSRHRERQSGEWHWYAETSDTVTSCCTLPLPNSAFCLSRRRLLPKIFMF